MQRELQWVTILMPLLTSGLTGTAYKNLTAPSGGNAVYFSPTAANATGAVSDGVFVIRAGATEQVSGHGSSGDEIDVNDSDTIAASSSYSPQICNSGSTCVFAAQCAGGFSIAGAGMKVSGPKYQTFIRLDRSGKLAWIEQRQSCYSFQEYNSGLMSPALNGLYETSSLRQVAPGTGARLANRRHGRRMITNGGRALTFVGPQLTWLDATGSRPIRHVAGAFEAVTDATGANVVYVEAAFGKLHWIDVEDRDLGLTGSAPALSDDGSRLFFLAEDHTLWLYERATGAARRLGDDTYSEFALGGSAVFAVTGDDRIVRIDAAAGSPSTWLRPYPEIQSADAPSYSTPCPYYCYGPPPYITTVGRGMLLVLKGRHLDETGWRIRAVGIGAAPPVYAMDIPLQAISETAAWIQIPSDMALNSYSYQALQVYNPNHPIVSRLELQVRETVVACIGTLHEDFSRPVSPADPAVVGETVHVFLTGLRGIESIPDGVPNPADRLIEVAAPPALADPAALAPIFFGLAPGLIGVQQLDLHILAPSTKASLFLGVSSSGCAPPPVSR